MCCFGVGRHVRCLTQAKPETKRQVRVLGVWVVTDAQMPWTLDAISARCLECHGAYLGCAWKDRERRSREPHKSFCN